MENIASNVKTNVFDVDLKILYDTDWLGSLKEIMIFYVLF